MTTVEKMREIVNKYKYGMCYINYDYGSEDTGFVQVELETNFGCVYTYEINFTPTSTLRDFSVEFQTLYRDFDTSYEAYQWLNSEGHGCNGAPYDMKVLYEDIEGIKNMLIEISDELWLAGEESEL